MKAVITKAEMINSVSLESLPEGDYNGTWGGYKATITIEGFQYRLRTSAGIRARSAPCIVRVGEGGSIVVEAT